MDQTPAVTVKYRAETWMLMRGIWAVQARQLARAIPACVVATAVVLWSRSTGRSGASLVIVGLLWVWCLYAYLLAPWQRSRAMVREPNFAGGCEIAFGEDYALARSGSMQTRYEWTSFSRLIETRSMFVLRIGRVSMMVVPKSAFESGADVDRFRDLARRKSGAQPVDREPVT